MCFINEDTWNGSRDILQSVWLFFCLFGAFTNGELVNSLAYGKQIINPCLLNLVLGNLLAIFCMSLEILNSHFKALLVTRDIAGGVQISSLLVHAITRLIQSWRLQVRHSLVLTESEVIADSPEKKLIEESNVGLNMIYRHSMGNGYVRDHLSNNFQFSERLSLLLTVFIWFLGICSSIPTFFSLTTVSCYINPEYETLNNCTNRIYYFISVHIFPLFIILFSLILSHYLMNQSDKEFNLVFSIVSLLFVNYLFLLTGMIYSCMLQKDVNAKTIDCLESFQVYITAILIPVIAYYAFEGFRIDINQLFRSKKVRMNKIIHI